MKSKVNNTKNAVSPNFNKAYGMLPASKQVEFRENLKEKCGWSHMTFHNKKHGETSFSPLEIGAVEEAFAEFNIDAWTGKYIKPFAKV